MVPDVEEFVAKIKPFVDAGFTEVGLVQIGPTGASSRAASFERTIEITSP